MDWVILMDREHYVAAGGERSEKTRCDFGVPQGSIVGSFLFSVYVSPIADVFIPFEIQFHQYTPMIHNYISL